MDLEKLVALGEKMGLSGAELRKWVSQKEKEAVERERLAAERAKEEKAAELERERQYFPVADLACAVATILATAVVIVSLGVGHKVLGHTDVYTFLGVPYAHPPLGEMRFRSTYLTNHFTIGQAGSNRDPLYDGRYLSGLGDVVVVVPNYRLGALGFLYMGISVAPGNVGLYNQLLVIEWTRHNIGRFGGNVSNLVLVSYGSGATATGYLLGSQVAGVREAGVVPRRAILMSGSPLTRYPDNTNSAARRMAEQAKRMRCLIDGQPDIKYFIESSASLFVKTAICLPSSSPLFKALIKSLLKRCCTKTMQVYTRSH
ncbi:hypothetical protein HPB51_026195 [Rhipicephalus microplus]|uniref:Carboxylesterase type B domain-containing protein n=1 Tax=Rhipicephalus microplus TaxID=6941 RepID=A0A9J6DXY2_RHIMP|nr:hypothetical protein HPB51_026195 [Rhipicephalus microplus]